MNVAKLAAWVALIWSTVNFAVWIAATVIVQRNPHLQHSIGYLTFVSNYALVSGSFAGITGALAALFAERS